MASINPSRPLSIDEYIVEVKNFLSIREEQMYSKSRNEFMSHNNIRFLITSIMKAVKNKMKYTLNLNNMPPSSLAMIMRSAFKEHGLNNDNMIEEEKRLLNKEVFNECIPKIIGNLQNYIWANSSIDKNGNHKQPLPMDLPTDNYSVNQLVNPLVMDDGIDIFPNKYTIGSNYIKINNSNVNIEVDEPLPSLVMPSPGGNRSHPDSDDVKQWFDSRLYVPPSESSHKSWENCF